VFLVLLHLYLFFITFLFCYVYVCINRTMKHKLLKNVARSTMKLKPTLVQYFANSKNIENANPFSLYVILCLQHCSHDHMHMKLVTYLNDYSEKLTFIINGEKFWAMHNMFKSKDNRHLGLFSNFDFTSEIKVLK